MKEKSEKKEVKKAVHKKVKVETAQEVEEIKQDHKKIGKYLESVGRRKTAIARVRLFPDQVGFKVNGKEMEKYFSHPSFHKIVNSPIARIKPTEKFAIEAKVNGGGINAQAEAVRHGISRALVLFDSELKKRLKKLGFIKRDPRAKERRKYGLKKARKAPQWSKR